MYHLSTRTSPSNRVFVIPRALNMLLKPSNALRHPNQCTSLISLVRCGKLTNLGHTRQKSELPPSSASDGTISTAIVLPVEKSEELLCLAQARIDNTQKNRTTPEPIRFKSSDFVQEN